MTGPGTVPPGGLSPSVAVALGAAGVRRGIHGEEHWRRVAENGLFIAQGEGVSAHVVLLFAVLHDCRRENDGHDPGHGPRAAALAEQVGHEPLGLSAALLALLAHAMRHHDRGQVTDHPLVGACWDADRLDLPRVGITPDPRLLSTATGRHSATIARFAHVRRPVPAWDDLRRSGAPARPRQQAGVGVERHPLRPPVPHLPPPRPCRPP